MTDGNEVVMQVPGNQQSCFGKGLETHSEEEAHKSSVNEPEPESALHSFPIATTKKLGAKLDMIDICALRLLFRIPLEERILESFSASETLS